jgi:hypothetical protein
MCGKKASFAKRRDYTEAKRKNRAFCGKECKKKFCSEVSSRTMSETNKRYMEQIKARRKLRNPQDYPGAMEKMKAKLKGRTFLSRGGNGQNTKQQIILHELSGLPMEYPISLKIARGHFPCVPKCYKVDLAHPETKLSIEVDGKSHNSKKWKFLDKRKTEILNFLGWKVLRFTNQEVDENPIGCHEKILSTISQLREMKIILQTES